MWTKEQVPILRVLLPMILGITVIHYLPILSGYTILLGAAGASLMLFTFLFSSKYSIHIWGAWFFMGMCLMSAADKRMSAAQLAEESTFHLAIVRDISPREGKGPQLDLLLLPDRVKVKAGTDYVEELSNVLIGDTIIFTSRLNIPHTSSTPWGFDYKDYLNRQNIYHSTYISESTLLEIRPLATFSLYRLAYKLKCSAISILGTVLPASANVDLIKSVTFGDKSSLDQDLKEQMQTAGLMHIMAVSGLHIGIIYMFFNYLFLLLKPFPTTRRIVILGGIWLFILLCGLPASAVRAGIMLSVYEIGKQIHRNSHKFNVLGISAFIILILEPFQLFQIGFQFSFLAISGIFFFYDYLEQFLLEHSPLPTMLSSSISMSFAAQAILTPLCLYYFGYVSYWFWFWTFLAIPLTSIIMIGSMTAIGLSFILPLSLTEMVAQLPYIASQGLEYIAYLQSLIPINGLVLHVPWYFMLAFLALIILYIVHFCFSVSLRKYLLYGTFTWLLLFSFHRTIVKSSSGVYIFSSFDESHILIKSGNKATVIGDPLSNMAKMNLTAHLGIDDWEYSGTILFNKDMELRWVEDEVSRQIAILAGTEFQGGNAEEVKVIYNDKPWSNKFKELENALNVAETTFIYEK